MKPLYKKKKIETKKKNRSKIEDCYLWRLVFLPILPGRGAWQLLCIGVETIWTTVVGVSEGGSKKKTNERKSFKSTNGHYLSLKPFSRRNYPKKSQIKKARSSRKSTSECESEFESESLRHPPQPLVHLVLLCLLSCNKWKNAKGHESPGHNALHIISVRIWGTWME